MHEYSWDILNIKQAKSLLHFKSVACKVEGVGEGAGNEEGQAWASNLACILETDIQ